MKPVAGSTAERFGRVTGLHQRGNGPAGRRPVRGPPPTRPVRPPPPTARREHPAAGRTPRGRRVGPSDPARTLSAPLLPSPYHRRMLLSLRANAVVPLSPHATPDGVGGSTWTVPGQDGTPRWNTAPPDPPITPKSPANWCGGRCPAAAVRGKGPADPPSPPQPMPGCRWRNRGIVPAVTGTLTPDPPPTRRFHRRDGTPPGRRLMTCPPASSPRFTRSPPPLVRRPMPGHRGGK